MIGESCSRVICSALWIKSIPSAQPDEWWPYVYGNHFFVRASLQTAMSVWRPLPPRLVSSTGICYSRKDQRCWRKNSKRATNWANTHMTFNVSRAVSRWPWFCCKEDMYYVAEKTVRQYTFTTDPLECFDYGTWKMVRPRLWSQATFTFLTSFLSSIGQ